MWLKSKNKTKQNKTKQKRKEKTKERKKKPKKKTRPGFDSSKLPSWSYLNGGWNYFIQISFLELKNKHNLAKHLVLQTTIQNNFGINIILYSSFRMSLCFEF